MISALPKETAMDRVQRLPNAQLDRALERLDGVIKEAKARNAYDPREAIDRALLMTLKAVHDCNPRPTWVKDAQGTMLYLNPAYTRHFKVRYEDYAGARDHAVQSKRVADGYSESDLKVVRDRKAYLFIEDVPKDGKLVPYRIKKWPVFLEGVLIGVAGESLGPAHETDRRTPT